MGRRRSDFSLGIRIWLCRSCGFSGRESQSSIRRGRWGGIHGAWGHAGVYARWHTRGHTSGGRSTWTSEQPGQKYVPSERTSDLSRVRPTVPTAGELEVWGFELGQLAFRFLAKRHRHGAVLVAVGQAGRLGNEDPRLLPRARLLAIVQRDAEGGVVLLGHVFFLRCFRQSGNRVRRDGEPCDYDLDRA